LALPLFFHDQNVAVCSIIDSVKIAADMFEIVNKAILVHPLFQGFVDFYSRLLKGARPESWFVVKDILYCVHGFSA